MFIWPCFLEFFSCGASLGLLWKLKFVELKSSSNTFEYLHLLFSKIGGHGHEFWNLIVPERGPDFPISDHCHGNGGKQRGWKCHVG